METKKLTDRELNERKLKCWNTNCNKIAHFEDWTGWRFCFKHWRLDYKFGRCHGLLQALRDTELINIFNCFKK